MARASLLEGRELNKSVHAGEQEEGHKGHQRGSFMRCLGEVYGIQQGV